MHLNFKKIVSITHEKPFCAHDEYYHYIALASIFYKEKKLKWQVLFARLFSGCTYSMPCPNQGEHSLQQL
jgi:hypothetical protein